MASSRRMLSAEETTAFCAQTAMILKAGIPLAEGLSIMRQDTSPGDGREIMDVLAKAADDGAPLHEALEAAGCFPSHVVEMARIGSESGRLDEVMDYLAQYYERENSVAKSVRSAVTYPLVMIGMMLLVIGVLIIRVMPIFRQVLTQLGGEMAPFAQGVMELGAAAGNYSAVIVAVIAAAALLLWASTKSQGGRERLARFRASFFATRGLSEQISSGRFASAMALMLSSGLDTDRAVELSLGLIDNPRVRAKIEEVRSLMAGGSPFSKALEDTGVFSRVYSRMLSVGFKTGSMDAVMRRLADRYQEETDTKITGLVAMIEPSLVAVFSVIVGMLLISVMLPLMGIMSSI